MFFVGLVVSRKAPWPSREITENTLNSHTMTPKILLTQNPDSTAIMTFNRPDARNALDLESMMQFSQMIDVLAADTGLRVLILTGAGRSFCSGVDLEAFRDEAGEQDGQRISELMGDALYRMEQLPVPVIAAVNGYALGGGAEVALACDLRVLDRRARIGFVHSRLALTPAWGSGQRLVRLVGYARAMEILLQARPMNAHDLQVLGLANQVAAEGKALDAALDMAQLILTRSPDVVSGIKQQLQASWQHPYEDALRFERAMFGPLWAGPAHQQAVDKHFRFHPPDA